MTDMGGEVVELPGRGPLGGRNENGGNGNLVRYRLEELERRMGTLEDKVDRLTVTCTRIDEKLAALTEKQTDLPSKSYVLWIFGATSVGFLVTLVGHLFIRSITGT